MTAALLRQSPDSNRPARLYVLTRPSTLGRALSSLLQTASTREGRLVVIHTLKRRQSPGLSEGSEPAPVANARPIPRTLEDPHA
jgi:hypothetical protein